MYQKQILSFTLAISSIVFLGSLIYWDVISWNGPPQINNSALDLASPPAAPQPKLHRPIAPQQGTMTSSSKRIYRWTNAEGVTQYGDEKPVDQNIPIEDKSKEFLFKRPYRFNVRSVSFPLTPKMQSEIEIALSTILDTYNDTLGLPYKERSPINVVIYGDLVEFESSRNKFAARSRLPERSQFYARLTHPTGFFDPLGQTYHIWKNQDMATVISVAAHLSSKASLDQKFRDAPAWLREGLAEYFGGIKILDARVIIPLKPEWDNPLKQRLRQKQLIPLKQFLAFSNSDWYGRNPHTTYDSYLPMAWSLVYFMMGSREGQQLLLQIIQHIASADLAQPDSPDDSSQAKTSLSAVDVEEHYYGGIERLEMNWHQWIKRNRTAHRY
ncbi:MAG: DUF1570 domain-containing protein [Pseudomonadales bacterium]|nr:DUF1570 domain-containing protein [Pseudomonadales bacterium]